MSEDTTERKVVDEAALEAQKRPSGAYLQVLTGAFAGRMFKLGQGESSLGRGDAVDFRLEAEDISRRHATVHFSELGEVTLTDLGSTNGTFVNGTRVETAVLKDGDKIQVGSDTVLKFTRQDALEQEFQRQLYDSAVRDGLTATYNKRFFTDRIREELAWCARHEVPLSVIMLDVDGFKRINDNHGHYGGDYVLQKVSSLLAKTIRTEDLLCRVGGDEFAIILRDIDEQEARHASERVRSAVAAELFVFQKHHLTVTVSGGFATFHGGNFSSSDELVAEADRYLYDAKGRGKNRVEGPVAQVVRLRAPNRK
jgi:diguanylate cyclase (GGDEF)-like protein